LVRVVAAIIRNPQNAFLITRRPAHAHLAGYWEFPGGTIEDGETDRQALVREISEELGVHIEIDELYWQEVFAYENKTVDISFYHCRLIPADQQIKTIGVASYRWVPAAQLHYYKFPEADKQLIEKLAGNKLSNSN
jgi:mutator protein MutT